MSLPRTPAGASSADTARAAPSPSFTPLYQQVRALLVRRLEAGDWRPGEAIPGELELAGGFKVSHGTVRKAIDALVAENLLVRRQGKGTYVATHAEAQVQYRFLRLVPDEGTPARLQRRLLACRRMRAPAAIASALGLQGGENAVQLRRLLLSGERPVVLDDIWLPAALFAGLTTERVEAWRGPMYRLFEVEFGVRMVRAEERLRAVAADADEARELRLGPGAPLLQVERLAYTYADRPVEWRRGLYDTRAHHYRNELS